MDKKIAALLGAVAGVSTMGAAQAATPVNDALQSSSYADLLAPVPNAVAALIADDATRSAKSPGEIQVAQIQVKIGHHHHHHRYHRKPVIVIKRHHRRHHHHHHHHHHSEYMAFPKAPV